MTCGFFAWLVFLAASSAWDTCRSRPTRLVERFNYYLTRWDIARRQDEAEIADLVSALASPEPIRRWQAAQQLSDRAAEEATPALIEALRDEAGTVRTCQVAHSLGRIGDRRAVPALIRALDHPRNTDLRVCAAIALGDVGDARALDGLVAAYRERQSLAALHAIGRLADPAATRFLRRVVMSAPDPMHRRAAAHGLELLHLANSADPVRRLIAALPGLPERSQPWAIARLVSLADDRAVEPRRALVSATRRNEEVRICAAAALASFGRSATPAVRRLAQSDDVLSRALGGLATRQTGDRPALAAAASGGRVHRFARACLALAADER